MRREGEQRVWRASALALMALALSVLAGCPGFTTAPAPQQVVSGSYDAETRYDMETLSGALTSSVEVWEAPELAIRTKILSRIEQRYGAQIANAVGQYYGAQISQQIRAYLQELAPAWLLDLPSKLEIVDAQMKMVDVQMSILLSDQGDGTLRATQIWDGISVFRDPSCREAGNLSCDQINISIQELLDAEYPIEIVSADFTGDLAGDTFAMRGNEVSLNYGRLALYLMTNLALPDEPGAGLQLRDVVLAAINCRGLAGRLAGDDGVLGWSIGGVEVGVSMNDLIGSCEDGVFAMINDFIDQFAVPMSMNLSGAVQLIDSDFDGTIDQLATRALDGQLSASLINGQEREGPVSAQLTGWRVGALPDDFGATPEGDGGVDIDDGVPIYDAGGDE